MKKLLLIALLIITMMIVAVRAKTETVTDPEIIRCTCYTADEGAITASGKHVREDIVAGKRDWIGCICVIYENNNGEVGDVIGVFEVADTGAGIDTDGDGKGDSIKNGKSIDVYRNTLDRCYEWVGKYGDYVFIQIIPAVG